MSDWEPAQLSEKEAAILEAWKRDLFDAQQRLNLVRQGFNSVVSLLANWFFPAPDWEWKIDDNGNLVGRKKEKDDGSE